LLIAFVKHLLYDSVQRKGVMNLATKTITVRVDEDTKQQAEAILDDIGLTVTGLFNACLKALVREQRVPFALVSSEYEFHQMVKAKLEASEAIASDPNAKRYEHEEIFAPLRERFEYEVPSTLQGEKAG
jgi:addiction module RelB/DinJ family antitoxin